MKAKKWILIKNFDGEPKEADLQIVEEEINENIKENEVLLQAVYLSVDPYMRFFTLTDNEPSLMDGEQVSIVVKSRNENFREGQLVLSHAGWVSHYITDGYDLKKLPFEPKKIPPSYFLGILGMPGAAAYFGLYELLKPKKDEILILNGAAGAVGSTVGQLAKLKGVKVIAFVGSDEKLDWCKNELGFDHVFNYKKCNFSDEISKVAPDGADLFFDNVGGEWYFTITSRHLKKYGRACVCGSIETYNDLEPKSYPTLDLIVKEKHIKVYQLSVYNYELQWPEAFKEIKQLLEQNKLKARETVYEGFHKMRDAFYGLFKGENIGKAIVKV